MTSCHNEHLQTEHDLGRSSQQQRGRWLRKGETKSFAKVHFGGEELNLGRNEPDPKGRKVWSLISHAAEMPIAVRIMKYQGDCLVQEVEVRKPKEYF